VKREEKEEGNVKASVFLEYFKSAANLLTFVLLFGYINRYLSRVSGYIWLAEWTTFGNPGESSFSSSQSIIPKSRGIGNFSLYIQV